MQTSFFIRLEFPTTFPPHPMHDIATAYSTVRRIIHSLFVEMICDFLTLRLHHVQLARPPDLNDANRWVMQACSGLRIANGPHRLAP
jgi:hypothetical protein